MNESEDALPPDNSDEASSLSEETINEFIEVQREDAQIRKEELEIRKQELEANREQAKRSLEAQVEDRENHRDYLLNREKIQQRYGSVLALLVFAFLGALVYMEQPQIAMEIVKVVVFGGGGYYAGKMVGQYGEGKEEQVAGDSA